MQRPRLVVAGTNSGAGKTTVTLALMAALKARGLLVQPFKAGPDFIDPGHHQVVTGRPSRNLDGWMLGEALNCSIFARASADADLSIIEGMMGLFDGSSPVTERGSTAELAKQLNAPVLLVIDGSAMARSAAAMASGYATFDPVLSVRAVLFNRVGSEGHYRLLREAVETETDLAVVGYLRPDASVTIPDRHLGLRTAIELGRSDLYDRLARSAAETVDLDLVEALARSAGAVVGDATAPARAGQQSVRIGCAYDAAFCFYYQDNLELLEAAGAEIVKFSPLRDRELPAVDLLYFGGGYPELYGEALAANTTMRTAVRTFAEQGGAVYAECGGLMYLTEAIRDCDGLRYEMAGIFPAEAVMRKAGLTLGYRTVEVTQPCLLGQPGMSLRGHEFHYSALESKGPLHYACSLSDAEGTSIGQDGLREGNTLALYSHLHFGSHPEVASELLAAARGSRRTVSSIGKV
ncbi:MAG: Cobyrinic acid a,c-diamide synthetase [Nitrospira sp.]|jgi:cobyrinic acid a,c-diamide synthase|nr:MAG: Cobyrinic acid a,c-diamide synthetase [Nitrospira sp.]